VNALKAESDVVGKLPEIPEDLYTITEKNMFESMIYPLTKDEFFDRIYCKKALVVRGSAPKRFSEIIKKRMFNLNILKML